jgi:O-antigen ligase
MEMGGQNVIFSPPYIDLLPGAVNSIHSWDMVVWFFPAFVAILIARHGFHTPRMVRTLFWGMIINASFLAIFGMIAPFLTKNYPAWLTPILPRQPVFFFSTFGYPNHAGSFFILHLGLACGLFFYYYTNRKEESRALINIGILSVIILLHFCAIHLARGRYAILFSWIMAAIFLFYLLYLTPWKNFVGRRKIRFIIITASCLLIVSSLFLFILSKDEIHARLSTMSKPGKFIAEQFDMKFWQVEAAAKIWWDYPLFGIGGDSYREYLLQYVKDPKKKSFAIYNRGMANVHNDFMQFLCEFGIIGAGLLIVIFILLIARIFTSLKWKQGFFLFGLLGISGVLIHSLIDLPFRSPPIIIAFMVSLAGYGMLKRPEEKIAHDKNPIINFVTKFINFYTLLILFIGLLMWLVFTPIRREVSKNIIHNIEEEYEAKIVTSQGDNVTPPKSLNVSPDMLNSLWWAKLLYSDYKNLHLLSAKINFDLYRDAAIRNENKAKHYLKEAFRSSMKARQFTNYGDIEFVKLYTAILDALGYHLEESWWVMNLGKAYPNNIRINLLLREYYFRRPYLIR